MGTRTLAVVSAGLSVPSSTRLLAERAPAAPADPFTDSTPFETLLRGA